MKTKTNVNGYSITLFHKEHYPHAETLKQFYAVLAMNNNTSYNVLHEKSGRKFEVNSKDIGQNRAELFLGTNYVTIREAGPFVNRDDFDRRVYATAMAYLDTFDIDHFHHAAVSIQSRLEPNPDHYNQHFSWQHCLGEYSRIPLMLQRPSSKGMFQLEFDPTPEKPEKVQVAFKWNQRCPSVAHMETKVTFPKTLVKRATMGRLSVCLKHAENVACEKMSDLIPDTGSQPGASKQLMTA